MTQQLIVSGKVAPMPDPGKPEPPVCSVPGCQRQVLECYGPNPFHLCWWCFSKVDECSHHHQEDRVDVEAL